MSCKHPESDADFFWQKVANAYAEQPEVLTPRLPHGLSCCWSIIQRVTQKYLACDRLYRENIPSGETEEMTEANIMKFIVKGLK